MNEEKTLKYGKIGGTTVSAIVGMNPWMTPHGAYLVLRNEAPPAEDNPAMARGRRYEPIVADVFAGGSPEFRVEHNRQGTEEPELYVHQDYDFLIGHPDRLLYDTQTNKLVSGLEIKTSNIANIRKWGAEGTDAIPRNYLIQCQWYAGLSGLPDWRVAVAFLDDSGRMKTYREYQIEANKELYETLVERAVDFWQNNVLAGNPPEIEAVDEATKGWLLSRYPMNVEPLATATEDEERIMEVYLSRRAALELAQKEAEAAEFALKQAIGERDGLISETFGKVTWKKSKDSTRVDYRAVCDELKPSEELLARFTKHVSGTRRFVVNLKSNA